MKRNQFNAATVLKGMNVHLSAFLAFMAFRQPSDLSEQYTKKGPGRKHKQGKARYV